MKQRFFKGKETFEVDFIYLVLVGSDLNLKSRFTQIKTTQNVASMFLLVGSFIQS